MFVGGFVFELGRRGGYLSSKLKAQEKVKSCRYGKGRKRRGKKRKGQVLKGAFNTGNQGKDEDRRKGERIHFQVREERGRGSNQWGGLWVCEKQSGGERGDRGGDHLRDLLV